MTDPAPIAADQFAHQPLGALIPPPSETTRACIEAALAHAETGMKALRLALAINSPRHLRLCHEKFAATSAQIEAALATLRLQAMAAAAGEEEGCK